ncbi:hypothetical protein Ait01nite_012460 [Actinoplanes italicus]|uniref:LppP/LprE lipoprotein n=1 Tax=Actinoplanes italicus TaxID=113567 RepID=A0A2T0KGX6_9ACTN|nr:hypothetical protein [Actinoplanes italicus]PRX22681.1 hypothetical protein CLV67_104209 [Actinoplanes italicus]GIE28201.1 hypothetical protein Ait01nite_012460 [Actinoplanes italicus]
MTIPHLRVPRLLRHCAVAVTCLLPATAAVAHAAPQSPPPADETTTAPAPPAKLSPAQRKVLTDATRRFRDVDEALAAGYLATDQCVPGMGWHYAHPGLSAGDAIDPVWPEVLLYVPGRDGTPRLVGVEYFKADADQDLNTDTDRPTLFGHPFDGPMAGHEMPPGAPPMPAHYDLHVWLYLTNPAGQLTNENPRIICP